MESEAIISSKVEKRRISPEFRIAFRLLWCCGLLMGSIYRLTHTGDLLEQVSDSRKINLEYSKNIDAETYLMTREQLKQLFLPETGTPLNRWEIKQTGIINDNSPLYLVIRLKNRGESDVWGRIKVHSERWGRGSGIEETEIPIQFLPAKMSRFQNAILAAAWEIRGFEPHLLPEEKAEPILSSDISIEWTSLYTSKDGG